MTRVRIIATLAAAAILAGCETAPDWTDLPARVTGDADQDPGIAIASAGQLTRQAGRLPRLALVDCGPFRVDIRSHRLAPGPDDRQPASDGTVTPDLALIVLTPEGFDGRIRFSRATMPFKDARIMYRTGTGWLDVTNADTAIALGASVPLEVEPVAGAKQPPPQVDLYLGFDPARHPLLVVDGKFAVTDNWITDPGQGTTAGTGGLRPGSYRITTGARYELDSALGGCAFTLPDLVWQVPD